MGSASPIARLELSWTNRVPLAFSFAGWHEEFNSNKSVGMAGGGKKVEHDILHML